MAEPVILNQPGLLCPQCRVDLVMSDRQGIEIDYCPNCRGVWLDRGELDKIIDRSLGAEQPAAAAPKRAAPPPPPAYGQNYRNDDGHGHGSSSHGGSHGGYEGHGNRRRKSWLGEIFD